MTDLHNIPLDPTEPPPGAVDGFVFRPVGSDVVQVWQKINGQHMRIDDATAPSEGKASE